MLLLRGAQHYDTCSCLLRPHKRAQHHPSLVFELTSSQLFKEQAMQRGLFALLRA